MNPNQPQTLTKADLESHLNNQIQQMDSAYASAGYTRVGNSYVRNPQTDAALQAVGSATGQYAAESGIPQKSSDLQGYVSTQSGQPPAPGTTLGDLNSGQYQLKPQLSGTQQQQLTDTTDALQTINTLQGLLNSNGKDIRLGRLQGAESSLRNILGPKFPGLGQSDSEQQFDYLAKQLSAHALNALAGARGETAQAGGGVSGILGFLQGGGQGSGVSQIKQYLPTRSDTSQEIKNKLTTLQEQLLSSQKNTLGAAVNPTNLPVNSPLTTPNNDPLGLFK